MKNKLFAGVLGSLVLTVSFAAFAQVNPTPPVAVTDNFDLEGAKTDLAAAKSANTNGEVKTAIGLFQSAYEKSPVNNDGRKIAMESAKRLGFLYLEGQDFRRAEASFAAEAIIGRKLYFEGSINSKPFIEAVRHWATAAGLMTRSDESAALVFYANEIGARERAAQAAQIQNREAIFASDEVEGVRVNVGNYCATEYLPFLKSQVECKDELSAKSEAIGLQLKQIKADAPPEPSKAEKEAKEKAKQKEE